MNWNAPSFTAWAVPTIDPGNGHCPDRPDLAQAIERGATSASKRRGTAPQTYLADMLASKRFEVSDYRRLSFEA